MILPEFEEFLLTHEETYLTPASEVVVFADSHNTDHVMLLLASNGYSRVPVINKERQYVGTISVSDIVRFQSENDYSIEELASLPIAHVVNKEMATISPTASMTKIMHKLVDASFLPVVGDEGEFVGIITRRSILKAVNSLLHNFADGYDIRKKEHES